VKYEIVTEDPLRILHSTRNFLENFEFVEIREESLKNISKMVEIRIEKGLDEATTGFGESRKIADNAQLIFVEDAVNFCFWAEKNQEKWQIEWPKGNIVKGGWFALVKSFERAFVRNNNILNAKYLESMTVDDVDELFKSSNDVEIPIIQKRLENLHEAGKILSKKYRGEFINLIEESNFDAINIVRNVYTDFSSFADIVEFNGQEVYFLKRAQIVANDLVYIFEGKIKRAELLTAFADYKLPQFFREYGLIKYSDALANKVDNYELIPSGSKEEIEIRSATIWAVELLRQKLGKYTASQIDDAVWLLSQDQTKVSKPYHRTYTIFY